LYRINRIFGATTVSIMTFSIMTFSIIIKNKSWHSSLRHSASGQCSYAEFHIYVLCAKCRYAKCRYAECRYAKCCYTECRYAECYGARVLHKTWLGKLATNKHSSSMGSVCKLRRKLSVVNMVLKLFSDKKYRKLVESRSRISYVSNFSIWGFNLPQGTILQTVLYII